MDNDTISRQVAIDALITWEEDSFWDKECLKHRGEPFWLAPSDVIKQLPSAERHGRWIELYKDNYKCSVCNAWYRSDEPIDFSYCPDCGAKMDLGE